MVLSTWLLPLLALLAGAPFMASGSYSAALPMDVEILLALSPEWPHLRANFTSGRFMSSALAVAELGRHSRSKYDALGAQMLVESASGLKVEAATTACLMLEAELTKKPQHPERLLAAEWACIRSLSLIGMWSSALKRVHNSHLNLLSSPAWPLLASESANLLATVGAHEAALHLRRLIAAHLTKNVGGIRQTLQSSLGVFDGNATRSMGVELPLRSLFEDWQKKVARSKSSVSPEFRLKPPQIYSWRMFMRDLGLHLQQLDHRSAAMYLIATSVTERKGLRPVGPDMDWALPMLRVLNAQSRSFVAGLAGIGPRSASLLHIRLTGNYASDEGTRLWRQALDEVEAGDYAAAHRSMRAVLNWEESHRLFAKRNPETLNALAYLELEQQRFEDALNTSLTVVSRLEVFHGSLASRNLQWMRATYLRATAVWGIGMLQMAADLYKQVAHAVKSTYGRHHVLYATSLTEFCYIKEEMMVEQMLNKCVEEEDAMVEKCLRESQRSNCHDGSFMAPGCDPMQLQLAAAERTLVLLDKAAARWHCVENYRLNLDWQHLAKRRQLMATRVAISKTASPIERGVLSFLLEKEFSWRNVRSLYHSTAEAVVRVLGHEGKTSAAEAYAKAALGVMSDALSGAWQRGIVSPSDNNMRRIPVEDGPQAHMVPGSRGGHVPLTGEALVRGLARLQLAGKKGGSGAHCSGKGQSPDISSLQQWALCHFPTTSLPLHMTNGSLVEPRHTRSAPGPPTSGPTGAWALPQMKFRPSINPAAFWGGQGLVGDMFSAFERAAPAASLTPQEHADQLLRRCRATRVQDTSLLYVQVGFLSQGDMPANTLITSLGGGSGAPPLTEGEVDLPNLLPTGAGGPWADAIQQLNSGSNLRDILSQHTSLAQTTGNILGQALLGSKGGVVTSAENMFRPTQQVVPTNLLSPDTPFASSIERLLPSWTEPMQRRREAGDPVLQCETAGPPTHVAPQVHPAMQELVTRLWATVHANKLTTGLLSQERLAMKLADLTDKAAQRPDADVQSEYSHHVRLQQAMVGQDTMAVCRRIVQTLKPEDVTRLILYWRLMWLEHRDATQVGE